MRSWPSNRSAGGAFTELALAACVSNAPNSPSPTIPDAPANAERATSDDYQPLAIGDSWTFVCNHQFDIVDHVPATAHIGKRLVYELSLQIPSSPTKSVTVVQLLANDSSGSTWIYGYLLGGKVRAVKPTRIVAHAPVLNRHYDYPGPTRGTIERIFKGFEYTNHTPLGVFWVAPYFESASTHNYGYSLGRGVMEEDHGPNFRYDCLIKKYVLH